MKHFLSTSLLLCCLFSFAQEFTTHENGLIYSPKAMEYLKGMVGKKNQEFRVCELNKTYTSFEQTKGFVFALEDPDIESLKKDLFANISLKEFLKKYSTVQENGERLLTKVDFDNYDGDRMIRIKEQPEGHELNILVDQWQNSRYGKWIWDFSNPEYVRLAYLIKDFSTTPIPVKYGRMIQYSECLIDTTSQIFMANASKRRFYFDEDSLKVKQTGLEQYIHDKLDRPKPVLNFDPKLTEEQVRETIKSYHEWESAKESLVTKVLSRDPKFLELLYEAYVEALEHKSSDDEFEEYVANFLSAGKALALKRNRIVVGQCSMDDSPRVHAMNIAQLAGESLNWDIFLRAHLNVLNDNVNRVSDGSWAWAGRNTYIKELEELNINVLDLIFGIALRSSNVATGHYYGSISRLGRAISESNDLNKFDSELSQMIADSDLDDFNRMLMFYLYDNLSYHADQTEEKTNYKKNSSVMKALLPEYLQKDMSN